MSLSPWDLSGHIRLDVDQFRPRRTSYVFATQMVSRRARRESYRTATRTSDSSDGETLQRVEGRLKRKESYRSATQALDAANTAATTAASKDQQEQQYQQCPQQQQQHQQQHQQHDMSPSGRYLTANGEVMKTSNGNGNGNCITNPVTSNNYLHPNYNPHHVTSNSQLAIETQGNGDLSMSTTITKTGLTKGEQVLDSVFVDDKADDEWESIAQARRKYRKDVVILTLGFVFVFSSFRAIQNLESSLNVLPWRLGVICMGTMYCVTFLCSHLSPMIIQRLLPKRAMVIGLVCYLVWTAANCFPRFYTLLPASICLGVGQSVTWDAMIIYIRRRVADYAAATSTGQIPGTLCVENVCGATATATDARANNAGPENALNERTAKEMSRFHNIFLASFQTSHIWGNLISSLMLDKRIAYWSSSSSADHQTATAQCGAYESYRILSLANASILSAGVPLSESVVAKLMGTYMILVMLGFIFIFMFLSRVVIKQDDDEFFLQIAWRNVSQISKEKGFRLLIPFLIFNGFQQGFIFADYSKSFVTCSLGVHYVGYCLMTFGVTSALFSLLVGLAAHHIPRDTVVGIGAVLHLGLMVFLVVWQPDYTLVAVFFIVSCLWGVCDAIWLTQCSCLVSVNWLGNMDVAFQNLRMFQSFGLAASFTLAAFISVTMKLYLLIGLLGLSTTFYVAVEYYMRRREGVNQRVDSGSI